MTRVVMDSQILTTLQICEEMLNLRFNHNLVPKSGQGKPIEKGSLMHAMLQHYYLAKRDGRARDEQAQEALKAAKLFIEGCQYCIAGMKCPDHKDTYKGLEALEIDEAYNVVKVFEEYHQFWKNDSWIPINVEAVKGAVIYEDDELSLLWKAKIDLEADNNEGLYSVDHKTASRKEETLSLNNQFIGQCVVTKQTRMYVNKIGFQTTLKPEEKFERTPVNYTKERISEWILETASYAYDLIDIQKSGQYRHKFTSCMRRYGPCIFRKVCEGQPNDRERLIQQYFKVADKVWDVGNED